MKQDNQWDLAPDPVDPVPDLHLVDREALGDPVDPRQEDQAVLVDRVDPEGLGVAPVGRVDSRLCLHFPK